MLLRMEGMGAVTALSKASKCPPGQIVVFPGTKSETCRKPGPKMPLPKKPTVVNILPPKPKPKPSAASSAVAALLKPATLLSNFLDPFRPAAVAAALTAAPQVPAGAPPKIFGIPRTPAIVGGVALAVGLGYLVLRRR